MRDFYIVLSGILCTVVPLLVTTQQKPPSKCGQIVLPLQLLLPLAKGHLSNEAIITWQLGWEGLSLTGTSVIIFTGVVKRENQ